MITITPETTTGDLIEQIKAAGGLAVVEHDGTAWLMATPEQASPWEPALQVLDAAAVTR